MHRISRIEVPTEEQAAKDRVGAPRRSQHRDVPLQFNWRSGSNSVTGLSESILRWRSSDGSRYAVLASPDGTVVWMSSTVRTPSPLISISFDARDLLGLDCCVPIVYAGRLEPIFPAFFHSDFSIISSKWKKYTYTAEVPHHSVYPLGCGDEVIVAIGFANPDCERAEVPAGQTIGLANIYLSHE